MKDKHGTETEGTVKGAPRPSQQKKQKSLRKKNRHPVLIGLVVVALVVGVGLYYVVAPAFASPPFPCGAAESYIHVHPYLSINIEGQNVAVPTDVGYLQGGACVEPMHTHDASGIIHIELPQAQSSLNFTLSDFFRVWAATYSTISINGTSHPVVLNSANIFGFQNDATHHVVIKVDNATVTDPSKVYLERLDYCNATNSVTPTSPCYASAGGSNPYWHGSLTSYPFGTGHTVVIEYVTT
jgi:hypothetical protein